MTIRDELMGIHEWLERDCGISPLIGHMHTLRSIIAATDPNATCRGSGHNSLHELREYLDSFEGGDSASLARTDRGNGVL